MRSLIFSECGHLQNNQLPLHSNISAMPENTAGIHFPKCPESAVSEHILSKCKIHLFKQRFGLSQQMHCCKHSKTWRQNVWSNISKEQTHIWWINPWYEKQISMFMTFDFFIYALDYETFGGLPLCITKKLKYITSLFFPKVEFFQQVCRKTEVHLLPHFCSLPRLCDVILVYPVR